MLFYYSICKLTVTFMNWFSKKKTIRNTRWKYMSKVTKSIKFLPMCDSLRPVKHCNHFLLSFFFFFFLGQADLGMAELTCSKPFGVVFQYYDFAKTKQSQRVVVL